MPYAPFKLDGQATRGLGIASKQGSLWHAVDTEPHIEVYVGKALCGVKDGPKSFGFVRAETPEQKVTCPRCLKKLEKASLLVFSLITLEA